MKPILVFGKNGQIGSHLVRVLRERSPLVALGHEDLDLSKPAEIRRSIREIQPSIIVNAAAYTAVDRAEEEPDLARAINGDAPAVIAEEAKKIDSLLVHYSTDYVFDGAEQTPYGENDTANPLSVYGHTKLAAEQAIRAAGVTHLIFRTAWVYATSGKNFLLTILRMATEREELRIVDDQKGAPTWSREVAAATARVFESVSPSGHPDAISQFSEFNGTYHLTAAGETTWYGFARAILDECSRLPVDVPWLAAATKGQALISKRVLPIPTIEYPTPARRPAYSVLSNAKFSRTFDFSLSDWREQLIRAVTSQS